MFTIHCKYSGCFKAIVATTQNAEDALVCAEALFRASMNKCEDGELPFEFQVYRPDLTLLKEFNLR